MPEHDTYIEAFVGGGNILERKRPAPSTIVIDRDPAVCMHWEKAMVATTVVNGDAVPWLRAREWTGRELVYCDPPYVHSTRTKKGIYRFEMSDEAHADLLSVLLAIPARAMLSGYRCELYDAALSSWRRVDFPAMTHGGVRIESVWMNFDPPAVPFDLSYVGANYRERERIKRKRARWAARLRAMPAAERAVILAELNSLELESAQAAMQDPVSPAVSMPPAVYAGAAVRTGEQLTLAMGDC
ncbi:DNA adenine methylase [Burkholderia perseverans]|uniref:DNA adenine methylase n=1 Tax=Burkholderia perseverans TaxID=2615214 RepID=UPI001FEF9B24|nr:DNA adenine methylase [Burkholderia perseverans]